MIENTENQVAVVYQYQTDNTIQISRTAGYRFVVRNNVSLGWVSKDHLTEVLRMRRNCLSCNPTMFKLATQAQVDRWLL